MCKDFLAKVTPNTLNDRMPFRRKKHKIKKIKIDIAVTVGQIVSYFSVHVHSEKEHEVFLPGICRFCAGIFP